MHVLYVYSVYEEKCGAKAGVRNGKDKVEERNNTIPTSPDNGKSLKRKISVFKTTTLLDKKDIS